MPAKTPKTAATKSRRPSIPKATSDAVLREWNHRCAICGADRPHLHHIDEDNTNNDPANLLPLCPNHHLTDQHDPTRQVDPGLLALFRKYKDPQMLSPRFQPVYRRLQPLMNIPDGIDFNGLSGLAGEVSSFVSHFTMGDYYRSRIAQHFEVRIPAYEARLHDEVYAAALKALKLKIAAGLAPALDLIVEQLRYQDWPAAATKP